MSYFKSQLFHLLLAVLTLVALRLLGVPQETIHSILSYAAIGILLTILVLFIRMQYLTHRVTKKIKKQDTNSEILDEIEIIVNDKTLTDIESAEMQLKVFEKYGYGPEGYREHTANTRELPNKTNKA